MVGLPTWESRILDITHKLRVSCFYRRLARRCDVIVFIAPEERDVFLEQAGGSAGDRAVVLRHGVDVTRYRPQASEERFDFVLLGRMGSARNADDAMSIYDAINRLTPGRPLRWAFVGPEPTEELRMLRGPLVEVPGEVGEPEAWVAAGRIFLGPGTSVTGVKTTVLQALAMGKPVVVHEASSRGLNLEKAAIVCGDHFSLAAAAVQLLGDLDRTQSLGEAARETVQAHYDVRAIAQELVALCSEAIRTTASPA